MSLQDPATVSAIAARLMRGHDVRMARIGILRSSWTPARQEGAHVLPPFVDIVLDTKPNLAESEPPVPVDFLCRRIREKLSEDAPVTVDGLGTFRQDEDGLVFNPDDRLRHSVNAGWGHLEPHDLPAAPVFATPPDPATESSVDADFDTVLESGTVSAANHISYPGDVQEPGPESVPGPEPETEPVQGPEPETEPVQGPDPKREPEPEQRQEPELSLKESSRPVPEWKDLASTGGPSAPKERRTAYASRLDRKRDTSRMPVWLMIAGALVPVLVVVLGVLLWPDSTDEMGGIMGNTPSDTLMTSAESGMENDTAAGAEAGGNEATADSPMLSAAPDSVTVSLVEPPPATPTGTPPSNYALSRGLPGYTLIIASGIGENSAMTIARSFDDLGLPYGVLTYPSDGGTLNRLALGQWPTVAAADSMRTVLADRLPEGTWVKRLD